MPPDRSLGEYVSVFTVLAKLITRLSNGMPDFLASKSAALLVCLHRNQKRTFAIAIVGFSVTGRNSSRTDMISRRKSNLPVLSEISKHGLKWKPGSCAEAETFAHLGYIHGVIRDRVTNNSREPHTDEAGGTRSGSEVVTVNLTMSLCDQDRVPSRKRFCEQCKELRERVFATTSVNVFDLCPSY
jgi:hypothetical protein